MNRRLYLAALSCLALAACAGAAITSQPWLQTGTASPWQSAEVDTRIIGLGLPLGSRLADGVRFAGGVQVLTPTLSPVRSLSDLKLIGTDGFVAVSDKGELVRGRIELDAAGQLVGLSQWRSRRLTLSDGQPITEKIDGDAEGLAILANGDLLVSFEGNHRIWNYGPLDAMRLPTSMVRPVWPFGGNEGMEALASSGSSSWRVGGETGGIWDCHTVSEPTCTLVRMPPDEPLKVSDYRTTGMDLDPDGQGWWVVQRAYTPPMDMRARVRRMDEDGALGPVLVELKLPATTDNFEGIAATKRDGKTRLYILSDDNENPLQRTLMLAFDVTP
ncbi:esterase-like activity of phytase family protein [Brevundimonas sp.]|uniref:esterase-like activity of phytase family protein n=1 Tax=Brevundimonas sp. TaxID=1871086 RepID=UPI00289CF05D|nr:esterase-like activity of phytase family protein [Brevundimonas sp.]